MDQFIRGKGVYDRNNLCGNGLIFFDYGGEFESELEVIGYEGSKEFLGNDIVRLEKELLIH